MKHLAFRFQRVSDARRFVEILLHPEFVYFPVKPTLEEEKAFLRQNREWRKNRTQFNFSIVYRDRVVGAIGIKIDQHRNHIGELGYFIDRDYWNKGIATAAVRWAEAYGFSKLGLRRFEILTLKANEASRRVAEKAGYRMEGVQRGKITFGGRHCDACCYSKIRRERRKSPGRH